MKTLVLGGTRFVGKALVSALYAKGHQITIFTRGNRPIPDNVDHLKGDRTSIEGLKTLKGREFDVIADVSGRTLSDTQRVLELTGMPKHRFLYVSSAGVYKSSKFWPIDEASEIDPSSRHSGKADTENWLLQEDIPFTSFRPTYIYGPGNYNPIERWFFDRIINNRPIPIPGDGKFLTQLGHVSDLSEAMSRSLDIDASRQMIYNCSSKKAVTFDGLVETAALICGKELGQIDIRLFDYSRLDPKARKAFPLRIGHFYTDISRIEKDLGWTPKYDLKKGLLDSYKNDYLLSPTQKFDFSSDDSLIGD